MKCEIMRAYDFSVCLLQFFILHFSFEIGRAASQAHLWCAALASGYPLHHPLRAFGTLRVVPLLSLSQTLSPSLSLEKGKGEGAFILLIMNLLCVKFPFPFLRERARDRVLREG
jgi:hypothetical protein